MSSLAILLILAAAGAAPVSGTAVDWVRLGLTVLLVLIYGLIWLFFGDTPARIDNLVAEITSQVSTPRGAHDYPFYLVIRRLEIMKKFLASYFEAFGWVALIDFGFQGRALLQVDSFSEAMGTVAISMSWRTPFYLFLGSVGYGLIHREVSCFGRWREAPSP